jgi:hypothetical protein
MWDMAELPFHGAGGAFHIIIQDTALQGSMSSFHLGCRYQLAIKILMAHLGMESGTCVSYTFRLT